MAKTFEVTEQEYQLAEELRRRFGSDPKDIQKIADHLGKRIRLFSNNHNEEGQITPPYKAGDHIAIGPPAPSPWGWDTYCIQTRDSGFQRKEDWTGALNFIEFLCSSASDFLKL